MLRKIGVAAGKILLFFVISLGLVGLYVAVIAPRVGLPLTDKTTGNAFVALQIVQLASMVLTAWLMRASFDRKGLADMGLAPRGFGDIGIGLVIGSFIFFAALAVAFLTGNARLDLDLSAFSITAMFASGGVMIVGAAMEEVMMRGYVLQELISKFSTTSAVIVSSLIFVVLHANALIKDEVGIVGAANIFFAAVLMSVAYLQMRSLWLPIGIHAGWNFTQGPLLGINVSGTDFGQGWHTLAFEGSKWMTGGQFGFEASLPGLLGPLIGIVLLLMFMRPRARPAAATEHA